MQRQDDYQGYFAAFFFFFPVSHLGAVSRRPHARSCTHMCARTCEQSSGKGRRGQAGGRRAGRATGCTLMKHSEKWIHRLQLPETHIKRFQRWLQRCRVCRWGRGEGWNERWSETERRGIKWYEPWPWHLQESEGVTGGGNLWKREVAPLNFFSFCCMWPPAGMSVIIKVSVPCQARRQIIHAALHTAVQKHGRKWGLHFPSLPSTTGNGRGALWGAVKAKQRHQLYIYRHTDI